MSADLDSLIARVERLDKPDRSVDGELALIAGEVPSWATTRSLRQRYLWSDGGAHIRARTWLAPEYTASTDAILALIERRLPGWEPRLEPRFWYEPTPHVMWLGMLIRPNWERWNPVNLDWFDNVEGPQSADKCLALVLAFLHAIKEQTP